MTVSTDEAPPPQAAAASTRTQWWARRVILPLLTVVVALAAASWASEYLRDRDANRLMIVVVAVALSVGGVFFVYWASDQLVDALPRTWRERIRPYVFVGPALAVLALFLIYPVVNTIIISLKDARGNEFVGLDNYEFVFTDASMLRAIRNSATWIVFVPLVAVSVGLVFATMADRLKRGEAVAKSLIFLPMAISFVGAAVTWRLIYSFRPEGFGSNIGLLNAVRETFDQDPVRWIQERPWNNFLLMVIMIWMQTGFAMVVLSAAIKAVPDEIIEAARIDGASEWQIFRRILVPNIAPTIVVVATYMIISALKVFDIVFVIGSAETNGTEVIAERMLEWFFISNHDGRGAAIAVVLFVAIIPVMVFNVRQFRRQEAIR